MRSYTLVPTASCLMLALASAAHAEPTLGMSYVDVTASAGIDHVNVPGLLFPGNHPTYQTIQKSIGQGAAVGDYDNDGDLDIYLCASLNHPNKLYRNNLDQGLKTFTEVAAAAGVDHMGLSRLAHFVDLDNDGWLDLFVINDDHPNNNYPGNQVYRNNHDGTFTNMTDTANARTVGYLRCGGSFADFDNDGLLDVYVTVWTGEAGFGNPFFTGYNRLLKNLGNFTFQDVTLDVGLGMLERDSFTPIFHDFDGDHRPDIQVAVDHTSDEFFHNTPDGFVRVTDEVGANHDANDMGSTCADFDDDGDLDVFNTNIGDPSGVWSPGQDNIIYLNNAPYGSLPSYTDAAPDRGVQYAYWGWGCEWSDSDQDGDLDLITVNGFADFIPPWSVMDMAPPVCFLNDGTGHFTIDNTPGMDWIGDSKCLIAFDYDRDGDDDLLVTNHNEPTYLLENDCPHAGHWLRVNVRQSNGNNLFGIGVTVYATVTINAQTVTKRREMLSAASYLAGLPAEVHFGLGDTTVVEELTVEWTDGTRTTMHDVAADQLLHIVQPTRACASDLDASGALDASDVIAFLDLFNDKAPAADLAPPAGYFNYSDVIAFMLGFAGSCP
ncbi:MAG: CRTAC1 family protein [Phycisphaerales bacterium]